MTLTWRREPVSNIRYTGFAYQKGAEGEPEIIPKDAETIRMIAQNFLNGDSLKRIKEKLEDAGIPAPAGRQLRHPGRASNKAHCHHRGQRQRKKLFHKIPSIF